MGFRMGGLRGQSARAWTIAVCVLAAAPATASAGNPGVVLGSPSYVLNGGGWGTPEPAVISNGGAPSGVLTEIRWRNWGEPIARGTARASLYKPGGTYYAQGGRALLRAKRIGTCPGQTAPAYTVLEVRLPPWPGGPPGSWFKWSGSKTICDYNDKDPSHQYPRWPGSCGYTGHEYGQQGEARDIAAYRVDCRRARRVVLRSRRLVSPSPSSGPRRACSRTGCRVRILRFRCHFQPIRQVDNDPLPSAFVQRVACRRGKATITWLYGRYPD